MLSLSQDVQAHGLDHHDMPGPGALLERPQAAIEGRPKGAVLPNSSEPPFENAESLEMVTEFEGFGPLQPVQAALKDLLHRACRGAVFAKIFRRLVEGTLEALPPSRRPADPGKLGPGLARAGKPIGPEVCDDAARPDCPVDLSQGMDHALRCDSSERP